MTGQVQKGQKLLLNLIETQTAKIFCIEKFVCLWFISSDRMKSISRFAKDHGHWIFDSPSVASEFRPHDFAEFGSFADRTIVAVPISLRLFVHFQALDVIRSRTSFAAKQRPSLRRRIFEGKLSVSPYFLHHYQDNNKAGMLLVDKLSLKTLGVYLIIIFWPKK